MPRKDGTGPDGKGPKGGRNQGTPIPKRIGGGGGKRTGRGQGRGGSPSGRGRNIKRT